MTHLSSAEKDAVQKLIMERDARREAERTTFKVSVSVRSPSDTSCEIYVPPGMDFNQATDLMRVAKGEVDRQLAERSKCPISPSKMEHDCLYEAEGAFPICELRCRRCGDGPCDEGHRYGDVRQSAIVQLRTSHHPNGVPGGMGHTWLAEDLGDPHKHKAVGVGYTEAEAIADLEETRAEDRRPSTPAPDRGVPGQRVSDEEIALEIRLQEDDPAPASSKKSRAVWLDLRDARAAFARATHSSPSEWRDAMEAAAKVADRIARHAMLQPDKITGQGRDIAAAIRALPPPSTSASPWRDIASAPKDKYQRFLAIVDREVRVVAWGKTSHVTMHGYCLADQGVENFDLCEPTHWMPLPTPPVTGAEASR